MSAVTMSSAAVARRKEREYDSVGALSHTLPARKTSAQIIREAKTALDYDNQGVKPPHGGALMSRVGVKTVQTRRPFTPREKERTLFGGCLGDGLRERRPPSSFSLSPLHFDPTETSNRLNTPMTTPTGLRGQPPSRPMSKLLLPVLSGRDANDDAGLGSGSLSNSSAKRRVHRYQFRTALSLCDLPEEIEEKEEGKVGERKNPGFMYRSSTFGALHPHLQSSDLSESSEEKSRTPQEFASTFNDTRKHPAIEKKLHKQRHKFDPDDSSTQREKEPSKIREPHFQEIPRVDQAIYYEDKIAPMLDEISRALTCGVDDGVLAELIQKLYNCLEAGGLLGRHFQYRTQVLKTIFKLVDREKGELLAILARTMLALKVRGNNLTSVCKLVFKVTRNDANDALFMEGNLLDLVLEAVACASPLEHAEACVYGYGALKFLTTNAHLVTRLLHRGVLELLVIHMKLIATQKEECGSVPEQTGYALVQLTGTLRHVSSCEKAFRLLLVTGAVEQVSKLFIAFHRDFEVASNIVRILSIISTQEECCLATASIPGIIPIFVDSLRCHSDRAAIVVRVAYALGNVMAVSNDARLKLFNSDEFPEIVLNLMADYIQKDRAQDGSAALDPLMPVSGSPEDVIVKLIRVLANMSVQPEVGEALAESNKCLSMLVSLINHKSVEESEELILSALATLNNLTFYTRARPPSQLHRDLAENLCELLPIEHVECLVEMIRVFGNLTHSIEIRNILLRKEVLEVLIEMLDCDSRELVFVCAGVLVNMMSDSDKRLVFRKEKGVPRMIDVLQYFGYGDWQLCCLVCQALWNYCASSSNILKEAFTEKELSRLSLILEEFLDEEVLFRSPDSCIRFPDQNARDTLYSLWEDFAAVASKLLDRIEEADASSPSSTFPARMEVD